MKRNACQLDLTVVCQLKFTAVLAACLVAGCTGSIAHQTLSEVRTVQPLQPVQVLDAGIGVDHGRLTSRTGCVLTFDRYRPLRPVDGEVVVLGHGFLRTKDQMSGLARALAAAGMTAVALDFCRDARWRGSHVRNGFDMLRVADELKARRVVYVGFSAGGLAALIAGRNDPRALGVVGLDLVDAEAVGRHASAGFQRPLIGLAGEPAFCNADGNGLAVYAANPHARVERVRGADHCDFESPTDRLCRVICGNDTPQPHQARRDIILAAAAAVVSLIRQGRDLPGPGG
jgi:dienelactone hydrolase